jgi:hypothetical protein
VKYSVAFASGIELYVMAGYGSVTASSLLERAPKPSHATPHVAARWRCCSVRGRLPVVLTILSSCRYQCWRARLASTLGHYRRRRVMADSPLFTTLVRRFAGYALSLPLPPP